MSTVFARRRHKLLSLKALRDSGTIVPANTEEECPSCGQMVLRRELVKNRYVCPLCGYHHPIGAYYRLSLILDEGSFKELDADLISNDPLDFPGYEQVAGHFVGGAEQHAPVPFGEKRSVLFHVFGLQIGGVGYACELKREDRSCRTVPHRADRPLENDAFHLAGGHERTGQPIISGAVPASVRGTLAALGSPVAPCSGIAVRHIRPERDSQRPVVIYPGRIAHEQARHVCRLLQGEHVDVSDLVHRPEVGRPCYSVRVGHVCEAEVCCW